MPISQGSISFLRVCFLLEEIDLRETKEIISLCFLAALDVKKQRDLSGFYRHLLNQTVGEEAIPDRSANKSVCIIDTTGSHIFIITTRSL